MDQCDAELDRSAVVKDRCVEECQTTLDDYQSEMDLSSADLGYMLYPQVSQLTLLTTHNSAEFGDEAVRDMREEQNPRIVSSWSCMTNCPACSSTRYALAFSCLDGAIEAYVHRPNITKSTITYDGRNEESSQQGPLVDRARAVFVSFRRLEMCFANCRRQQAMLCFERKK